MAGHRRPVHWRLTLPVPAPYAFPGQSSRRRAMHAARAARCFHNTGSSSDLSTNGHHVAPVTRSSWLAALLERALRCNAGHDRCAGPRPGDVTDTKDAACRFSRIAVGSCARSVYRTDSRDAIRVFPVMERPAGRSAKTRHSTIDVSGGLASVCRSRKRPSPTKYMAIASRS